MTCIEKYMKEHPLESERRVIKTRCPMRSGGIDIGYPDNCTADYSICAACWGREVPGTEANPHGNEVTYAMRAEVYARAAKQFGKDTQIAVAIEEMAELTKELCKLRRDPGRSLNELAEEIADATIMLEQLRLLYDVNEMVCDIMDRKVLRLAERISAARGASHG